MSAANPWLDEVEATLPRLLALFDVDALSQTWGQGDRLFWAWKLKDFGNATFQGAAHGLARLSRAGLLPEGMTPGAIQRRIESLFIGARRLTRGNGSLEEAFPYESSFCVTALVAWDLLSAVQLLQSQVSPEQRCDWLDTVAPMIGFLLRNDETHALISNHLATAVAALVLWDELVEDADPAVARRGRQLLDRILDNASDEGWFREYDGADPGYQSLAMHYLAEVDALRPAWGLAPWLASASDFLSHFVHPDGSFGGHYGSRETRIFYPGGIEWLARRDPHAAAVVLAMRDAVAARATVSLASIDESNLIPLFNAYCRAAELLAESRDTTPAAVLPRDRTEPWRRCFPEAGLLIDHGLAHHTVVALRKGGALAHFVPGRAPLLLSAALRRDLRGRHYSAQAQDLDAACAAVCADVTPGAPVQLHARLREFHQELPTPARFLVLRVLNLSVMRVPMIGEWVKRLLVRLLVTRRGRSAGEVVRELRFAPELSCDDHVEGAAAAWPAMPVTPLHSTLHMASRGYWQRGDDAQ